MLVSGSVCTPQFCLDLDSKKDGLENGSLVYGVFLVYLKVESAGRYGWVVSMVRNYPPGS